MWSSKNDKEPYCRLCGKYSPTSLWIKLTMEAYYKARLDRTPEYVI